MRSLYLKLLKNFQGASCFWLSLSSMMPICVCLFACCELLLAGFTGFGNDIRWLNSSQIKIYGDKFLCKFMLIPSSLLSAEE